MPACQHARTELLACWGAPSSSSHRQTSIASSPADHRPPTSMPACQHATYLGAGMSVMLGCIPAAQTCQHSSFSSLAGWPSTSMPAYVGQQLGVLWHDGVQPSSTNRPAFLPPSSLAGHQPACQHASNATTEVLACWCAPQQHKQTSIIGPLIPC